MDKDHRSLQLSRELKHAPANGDSHRRRNHGILRRGARVHIGRQTPAQLQLGSAKLINISLWGALVEHSKRVRVGEIYRLSFPARGLQVEVLAWAVRSVVSHVVSGAAGDKRIVYRTGLEFIDLEESVTRVLSGYLDHLRRQARSD